MLTERLSSVGRGGRWGRRCLLWHPIICLVGAEKGGADQRSLLVITQVKFMRRRGASTVELLCPPSVPHRIKSRCRLSYENCRCADDLHEGKHIIFLEEICHAPNRRDVNIIQYEQATGANMRVKVIVFDFRERISVRAIDKDEIIEIVISETR